VQIIRTFVFINFSAQIPLSVQIPLCANPTALKISGSGIFWVLTIFDNGFHIHKLFCALIKRYSTINKVKLSMRWTSIVCCSVLQCVAVDEHHEHGIYIPGCSWKTIITDNPVWIYGFILENLRSAHVPTLKIRTYIKNLNIHICHISTRRAIVEFCGTSRIHQRLFPETCAVVHQSDWRGNKGCPPFGGPPSKIRMVLPRQRVVAGVGTCKSGVDTGKAVLAVLSSSLTRVLQPFLTSLCSRPPHHHL